MKKLLITLLCMTSFFAVGCGSAEQNPSVENNEPQITQEVQEEEQEEVQISFDDRLAYAIEDTVREGQLKNFNYIPRDSVADGFLQINLNASTLSTDKALFDAHMTTLKLADALNVLELKDNGIDEVRFCYWLPVHGDDEEIAVKVFMKVENLAKIGTSNFNPDSLPEHADYYHSDIK